MPTLGEVPEINRRTFVGASIAVGGVVATTPLIAGCEEHRNDGAAQSSVVNAGVMPHPLTNEPVVALVAVGGTRKLDHVRADPRSWMAQPMLMLSTAPTWSGAWSPRASAGWHGSWTPAERLGLRPAMTAGAPGHKLRPCQK